MKSLVYTLLLSMCMGTSLFAQECLYFNAVITEDFCDNGQGIIDLNPSHGTAPYTYAWDNGSTETSITNLPTGCYTVTVTDADACVRDTTFCLETQTPVFASAVSIGDYNGNDISCFGAADGAATVTAGGGTAPYSYLWIGANNQTNQTITGLSAGTYEVIVYDNNGCEFIDVVTLLEPEELFSVVDVVNSTCPTCCDGSLFINVTGGTPPYMYNVNGISIGTNNIMDGLCEGTYQVDVIDANGCIANSIWTVGSESCGLSIQSSVVNPTCNNNDGSATVSVTNGTGPFSYVWSTGQTTPTITGLFGGTYVVTVTDNTGCSVEEIVFLNQANDIFMTENIINPTCPTCCDGEIEVFVTGGSPPYTYAWNNATGQATSVVTGLCTGDYEVIVTDANGCSTLNTYTIVATCEMQVSLTTVDASCWNSEDGAVSVNVSGGTAPYSYEYTGPSGIVFNTGAVNNLMPGTYILLVTDANGCQETITFIINSPPELVATVDSPFGICGGECLGEAFVVVTGGVGVYTYQWSSGETTPEVVGLCSGYYEVTVTDANGCSFVSAIDVFSSPPLELAASATNETCLGNDGTATVTVTNGTFNYFYAWSNGATTPTITGLTPGLYSVTVWDDFGCMEVAEVEVTGDILLETSTTDATCDNNDATATVTVLAGMDNPTYEWSNGQTNATASGLAPDWYSVTVTDDVTGCARHINVQTIEDPACRVIISGYVYNDEVQQNCTPNVDVVGVPNVLVQLNATNYTYTDANGYYEFTVDNGTYDVNVSALPQAYEGLCIGTQTVNATTPGTTIENINFYVKENIFQDLSISGCFGPARPGFDYWGYIQYCNNGTDTMDAVVTYVHSEILQNVMFTELPDTYDIPSQTVIWTFENLAPQTCGYIHIDALIPASTQLGELVENHAEITPLEGDDVIWNNTFDWIQTVTGSYDPNDKTAFPRETLIQGQDSIISYMIRFQNTGTDTAFTVVVKDQLSSDLDVRGLVRGASSHEYTLDIEDDNTLVFTFNNIMLPDSNVNEPASNGFLLFQIPIVEGLELGTNIENTAEIYFDYNEPIITNTTSNVLTLPSSVKEPSIDIPLSILPNPAQNWAMIRYELDEATDVQIQIFDVMGKVYQSMSLKEQQAGEQQKRLSLKGLDAGMYLVHLKTTYGTVVKKLMVF